MTTEKMLFWRGCLGLVFLALASMTACSNLLPHSESVTEGPWQSYADALLTFEQIVPYETRVDDLKNLHLDPRKNPNITVLNYSDVLRRFIPNPTVNKDDLDDGVRDCIAAKTACLGYEINQENIVSKRSGNFWTDFLNFKRKTDIVGWRFNGVILLKNGLVVYELTGGQPIIRKMEEKSNPLGPLQGIGESGSYLRY